VASWEWLSLEASGQVRTSDSWALAMEVERSQLGFNHDQDLGQQNMENIPVREMQKPGPGNGTYFPPSQAIARVVGGGGLGTPGLGPG
jgi:hypothetical protein